jgi:hypothetical protein
MSEVASYASSRAEEPPAAARVVGAVLALWLGLVLVLGAAGALAQPPGTPPLPIFVSVTLPLLIFVAAYRLSGRLRASVLGLDLRVVTAIHAWRFGGLGFLALAAQGVLPRVFAWPAGLGDMAIALAAPWLVLTLLRRPDAAASRRFITWNLLGMLDLVVAVGVGTLASMLASGAPGEVTTAPMAQLPLVLIPAYLVPLFLMLHLTALFQARRQA